MKSYLLSQTSLIASIICSYNDALRLNYFSSSNSLINAPKFQINNDFTLNLKEDPNLDFEFLLQKSDDELKKILNHEQLKNLALYIASKFSQNRLKTNEIENFDDEKKADILQKLKRSSDFLEFSSTQQLIENLKSLKNPEEAREEDVQSFLNIAFMDFLIASLQVNESNNLPKNQAIKKFINMLDSSDVIRIFPFKESSKIKFLRYLKNR